MNNPILKLMLSKYPVQTWWEVFNMGALGVGLAFFGSIAFTYNSYLNPLLWRVFSPKAISIGPGDHHALIMLLFGVAFYLTIYWKVNPIFALAGFYFYVEAYEGEWYLTYVAAKLHYGGLFSWEWMSVTILIVPAVVFYVALFGVPWKFLAWMTPVFVLWFLMGFPITNDFPAVTPLYLNLGVNAWEVVTHLYAVIGFFIFVLPQLQRASAKVKMKWWNPG